MGRHGNVAFFIPHLGCPHRCAFCDQQTVSGRPEPATPEEVKAGLAEAFSRELPSAETEIAFFGGSFTCLPKEEMSAFLETAYPYVQAGRCAGIRVSTRPDGINGEILAILARYGVTAVELGAQSMDDRVLALNRRGHTAGDVRKSAALLRGYPGQPFSVGLQIMTGLYGETKESRELTVKAVLGLKPDTLRIYPTVVLKGTELARLAEEGLYQPPTVEETLPWAADMLDRFGGAGIRVIRVGLHASPLLEGRIAGGAYHPALRELCEGELFRRQMAAQLEGRLPGPAKLRVHPRSISKAVGQGKRNLLWAAEQGFPLAVCQDSAMDLDKVCLDFG